MTDLWGFLLQTLTASGVAALLLVVKAMFRDQLPPRWQFAAWGVLGLVLLVPAGMGGRYVLLNWPWLVETVKTVFSGDYSLTRVTAPIPLPRLRVPETAAEWLYAVYAAGVLAFLLRYAATYLRLRMALRRGTPAGEDRAAQIGAVAERYGLPVCPAVEVPGLTSAFICGVFRPVLALPAGEAVDDKVLLHELLHLKYRDAAWGLVICLFRCVHWCNPLLWICAGRAGNDLEARCDQRVLERLEGEARRDYGRILLSMADERYARVPGTSSMANGGKNIRRRIQAIARFKRYPAGMALVSVCVTVTLAVPLLLGARAKGVYEGGYSVPWGIDISAVLASARTTPCTTYAGALDTYAKAVLDQNAVYRAMCAPLEEQAALAEELKQAADRSEWPNVRWDSGLPCWPNTQAGYSIYNLEPADREAYEGLLVVELNYPPNGLPAEESRTYLGTQRVRAEKQADRWVVLPQEPFRTVETANELGWSWGCEDLPAYVYQSTGGGFMVVARYQQVFVVDNTVEEDHDMSWLSGASSRLDTTPKPNAEFDRVNWAHLIQCRYVGEQADKAEIWRVGVSAAPTDSLLERPQLRRSYGEVSGSGGGELWASQSISGDWEDTVFMGGGGSSAPFDGNSFDPPRFYAADLYVNDRLEAELTLPLLKGGQPRW
ncbi:M56 family metallopeptidase [uncultured Dysosmobacter sp.]|uniref:M56 family metallopeptidase n=1 Tax=uncultured Dysosmobacter sp. TaxID=2591384 RepID=UPI00260AD019|nr:M56 family metallopeptidase [uncultured Dysosmobacter sp.]